jgi:ribosomal protein L11 methyltransferase
MWLSITIETDAIHADALSDALMGVGAISVSVEDALAGTEFETPQFGEPDDLITAPATPLWLQSRVIALFEPAVDITDRVARAMQEIGITETPAIDIQEVAEQDWVRLTQSQFDPIRITDRLWIVPSWHTAPNAHAINLVLDPGLAFGTGSHPTTFLCLQWLAEQVHGGETVLDYGCGSGILAIAAAKLGAQAVLGVDIDGNALQSARDNASANQVELAVRHSKEPLDQQFDLVVANILTNPLCVLAPRLAGCIAHGGRIALSGVLASQAEQVIAAYAPFIALTVGATHEGWVRLEGRAC